MSNHTARFDQHHQPDRVRFRARTGCVADDAIVLLLAQRFRLLLLRCLSCRCSSRSRSSRLTALTFSWLLLAKPEIHAGGVPATTHGGHREQHEALLPVRELLHHLLLPLLGPLGALLLFTCLPCFLFRLALSLVRPQLRPDLFDAHRARFVQCRDLAQQIADKERSIADARIRDASPTVLLLLPLASCPLLTSFFTTTNSGWYVVLVQIHFCVLVTG
uniref:Uncharacterized protein n=1 Tax=Anopheles christyi TaxID=43041 RepID=A0A182KJ03_9DIPT